MTPELCRLERREARARTNLSVPINSGREESRRYRTASGPGSPSGQPAWGGRCDRPLIKVSVDNKRRRYRSRFCNDVFTYFQLAPWTNLIAEDIEAFKILSPPCLSFARCGITDFNTSRKEKPLKMKRHLIALSVFAVSVLGLPAMAQEKEKKITAKEVPAVVIENFKRAYPKAIIRGYASEMENGKQYYEIESQERTTRRD